MDLGDAETIALGYYDEHSLDPERPLDAFRLARAWLGAGSVERSHAVIGPPASVGRFGGQTRIIIRNSVPDEYAGFYCLHEIGHLLLRREGFAGDEVEEERAADAIAAALIMPAPFIRRVVAESGLDPRAVTDEVVTTETAAVLRFGEVRRIPLVAVAKVIRVRGPESFIWPEEDTLRTWARARRVRPGLRKIAIADQRGRVALVADEDVSEAG